MRKQIFTQEHVDYVAEKCIGKTVVLDLETTGLHPHKGDKIAGIALYFPDTEESYYLSVGHPDSANILLEYFWQCLGQAKEIIGFNLKFDLTFCVTYGFHYIDGGVPVVDVLTLAHLMDENRRDRGLNYKLKDLAREYIDPSAADEQTELQEELKKRGLGKGQMAQLPTELVADYAMADVELTYALYKFYLPFAERWGILTAFEDLNKLIKPLTDMAVNGFAVDPVKIAQKIEEVGQETRDLYNKIQAVYQAEYPGKVFNPNSPAQVTLWLNSANARKSTLKSMSGDERAEMIMRYKELSKAVGTFYQPYLNLMSDKGALHSTIHIAATVTGRLSSSEPNLQQVPRQGKGSAYTVKDVFVSRPGYTLVQADYSQMELRLACHFSGEENMTRMFNEGIDLHQYTANELGTDRQTAKSLNFGLLYGMGADKFASMTGLPVSKARELVPAWHALYPAFRRAHNELTREAETFRHAPNDRSGRLFRYITLPNGRVRHYGANDTNIFTCWNTLIQGTGAIIMCNSLVRIYDYIHATFSDDIRLIFTVHDSVILEIRDYVLDQVMPKIVHMLTDHPYNPPMKVDISVGKSWGTLSNYVV